VIKGGKREQNRLGGGDKQSPENQPKTDPQPGSSLKEGLPSSGKGPRPKKFSQGRFGRTPDVNRSDVDNETCSVLRPEGPLEGKLP
jgi:hypothetical protein